MHVHKIPLHASYNHVQSRCYHDLILSMVTYRSMRDPSLESQFGLHIDTNYCAHGDLIICLNICSYFSYICHDHIQIKWWHVLDLALLVVTNQSMRDACLWVMIRPPSIDTNYCVPKIFIKYLNIILCLPYMRHIFILKLDDTMPVLCSSWWLQISLWEVFVSSHNLAPT
jgi:hypothetical protein